MNCALCDAGILGEVVIWRISSCPLFKYREYQASDRYFQPYSEDGSSDAAFRFQRCINSLDLATCPKITYLVIRLCSVHTARRDGVGGVNLTRKS